MKKFANEFLEAIYILAHMIVVVVILFLAIGLFTLPIALPPILGCGAWLTFVLYLVLIFAIVLCLAADCC